MLKAEYSSRLSFNDSFTMNYENIDIDFKSISNYLMDNSLAYESYDNSIIYRSFGRGISTQISNTELKDWKNNVSKNGYSCISYSTDGLENISNYFPTKYSNLANKVEQYINDNMNKDNNSPIETTNYTFQQTECFYGGGGNKVHYYTIDQFDFSKYRDYQILL